MFQKISIIGNLGNDPELRYLQNGTPVASFRVAVNKEWTNANNEKVKTTIWFKISVWNKQAETCAQYLTKGRQVFIEGELKGDPETGGPVIYAKNDGTAGSNFEVNAFTVKFLGGKPAQVQEE